MSVPLFSQTSLAGKAEKIQAGPIAGGESHWLVKNDVSSYSPREVLNPTAP